MSTRSAHLLAAAAAALEDGMSPFSTEWLADHDVTYDECMALSDHLATGARLMAWGLTHPEEARAAITGAALVGGVNGLPLGPFGAVKDALRTLTRTMAADDGDHPPVAVIRTAADAAAIERDSFG